MSILQIVAPLLFNSIPFQFQLCCAMRWNCAYLLLLLSLVLFWPKNRHWLLLPIAVIVAVVVIEPGKLWARKPANCFRVLQLNCLEQHNSPSFAGKVPKKHNFDQTIFMWGNFNLLPGEAMPKAVWAAAWCPLARQILTS